MHQLLDVCLSITDLLLHLITAGPKSVGWLPQQHNIQGAFTWEKRAWTLRPELCCNTFLTCPFIRVPNQPVKYLPRKRPPRCFESR